MNHIEQQLKQDGRAFEKAAQQHSAQQHALIMQRIQDEEQAITLTRMRRKRRSWPLALAASVAVMAVLIANQFNQAEPQSKSFSTLAAVQMIQQLDSESLEKNLEDQLMQQMRKEQVALTADMNYLRGLFVLNVSR